MIDMLTNTSQYTCGNVEFTTTSNGIAVYSAESSAGAFNAPALAAMYDAVGLHTLCSYNEIDDRVELIVFH